MNITKSFADFMVAQGYGTLGTDIYIGSVPLDAQDTVWWLIGAGGSPQSKNSTGEMQKDYILSLYYRSTDAEDVYDTMEAFERFINVQRCVEIGDYDIIEVTSTLFPSDQDLDNQDRTVGLMQITLTVYSNTYVS